MHSLSSDLIKNGNNNNNNNTNYFFPRHSVINRLYL